MAEENKSDFIRDPEVIRKEMEEFSEVLRKNKGFNIGSNVFSVDKDANGYVLTLRTVIDSNRHAPAGWKYGTYYLDGYPKTGFYTMKEGKFVFLPTKNEIDKSKEVEYRTVQDFKAAIEAANPHLVGKVSMTAGFGAEGIIQIEDAVNGIDLPTTDLYYDQQKGCIVSSINPGIEFRVEFISSAERSVDNVGNEATPMSSDVSSSLDSAAIRDVESRHESDGKGVSPREYGVQILNFDEMKRVQLEGYSFGNDGNVVTDIKDGTSKNLSGEDAKTSKVPDQRKTEAIMRLNRIWVASFHFVCQSMEHSPTEIKDNDAFMGTQTQGMFDYIVGVLANSKMTLKTSELPELLFKANVDIQQVDLLKAILIFVSHPEIAPMLNLEVDMVPDGIVSEMDRLRGERLHEDFDELIMKPIQTNLGNPPRL